MAGRSENRTQVQLIVCSPPLAANVRAPIHPFCRCCCSFSFIQTKEPSSRPKLLARFASSAVEKPASLPRPLPSLSLVILSAAKKPPKLAFAVVLAFCRCSCSRSFFYRYIFCCHPRIHRPQINGCSVPSIVHFTMGGIVDRPLATKPLSLLCGSSCFFALVFFVSSAVEKSASLPIPFPGPHRALTIAGLPIHSVPKGHGLTNTRKSRTEGPGRNSPEAEGHGFRGGRNKPGTKALPLCRRQERSPKGEGDSFYCPCLCSYFLFVIFCPKIACQVPKSLNPLPTNNIRVAC
jgi:hypothetical protein